MGSDVTCLDSREQGRVGLVVGPRRECEPVGKPQTACAERQGERSVTSPSASGHHLPSLRGKPG